MKNFNDYKKLLDELSQRKNDAAGSDKYSNVYGEVSTPELLYRKDKMLNFLLGDMFEPDGSSEEAKAYIDGIDSILNDRK